ncbi:MAG: hypothetical protein AB7V46_21970 [Thermomicrobiales bacterium]
MKLLLKSLLSGLLGASLFFSFFMPVSIAGLALFGRLTTATVDTKSVLVAPGPFLQHVGLPLSGLAFLLCFGLALRHFRQLASHPQNMH